MILELDIIIFEYIHGFAGIYSWLDWLGVFFADRFEYFLIAGLLPFVTKGLMKGWSDRRKYTAYFSTLGAMILSRFVITEIIRFFWQRPRPFIELEIAPLVTETAPAFPSGHAAFYFALAASVFFFNKKIGGILFAAAALISLARVFVGVHWPSDIIGGAAVGVLSAWIICAFSNRRLRLFSRVR